MKADALKELKRYKEAISMYDRAISKDQNPGYYYHKADCLKELKYYEEALLIFEEAITSDPNPKEKFQEYLIEMRRWLNFMKG